MAKVEKPGQLTKTLFTGSHVGKQSIVYHIAPSLSYETSFRFPLLVIMVLHAHHDVLLLLLLRLLLLVKLLLVGLVLLPHDSKGFLLADALSVPEHSVRCSIPPLLLPSSIRHLHCGLLLHSAAGSRAVAHGLPHAEGVGEVLRRLQVDGVPAASVDEGPDVVHRVHGGACVVLMLLVL